MKVARSISASRSVAIFNRRFSSTGLLGTVCTAAAGFLISVWLLDLYRWGDQIPYSSFYNASANLSLLEAYRAQYHFLTSNEPAFTIVMWAGAVTGVPKIVWVSLYNTILVLLILKILRRHRANFLVMLLTFSNFYLFVLITGAERLKFAYIFMILSIVTETRWRMVYAILAPFAHVQTLIYYVSLLSSGLFGWLPRLGAQTRFSRRNMNLAFILLMVGSVFLVLIAILAGGTIAQKVYFYAMNSGANAFSFVNFLLLFALGLIVCRRRARFAGFLLPLGVAIAIVGPDRVNMIAYTMFFYALLTDGRINHPLALLPMVYLSLKSIGFVGNVIAYGHGFPIH